MYLIFPNLASDRWQDPNWSNVTAPECTTTFSWDDVNNNFTAYNEDFSICWRDMDDPRKLPAFQQSVRSFTTPGKIELALVSHVRDPE